MLNSLIVKLNCCPFTTTLQVPSHTKMFLCVIKDSKFNKINTKIVWTVVIQVSKTSTNIPSATFRIAAESSENSNKTKLS